MGPWLGCYIGLMHSFDMETFCKVLGIMGDPYFLRELTISDV